MKILKEINTELIASGAKDGYIKIWNFIEGQLILSLEEHQASINCLIYLDGYNPPTLVSSSDDNLIKIWKLIP